MEIGLRVVRGPDWLNDSEIDGGEGFVGTVVEVGGKSCSSPESLVWVQWDSGNRHYHRAGDYGAYDLCVLDNASAGIKHDGIKCRSCKQNPILGMCWKSQDCDINYNLCTSCYMADEPLKQDVFLRLDFPDEDGVSVGNRFGAKKVQSRGIFPNAKVVRGIDWRWKNQDGGEGKEGMVIELRNWKTSPKRGVLVSWDCAKIETYRLGVKGKVDLKCSQPSTGGFYYKDHLPKLGEGKFKLRRKETEAAEVATRYSTSENTNFYFHKSLVFDTHVFEEMYFYVFLNSIFEERRDDDKKADLQILDGGAVSKESKQTQPQLKCDDYVKILDDEEAVKQLQKSHGPWEDSFCKVLGQTGRILDFNSTGDVEVIVGPRGEENVITFHPAVLSLSSADDKEEVEKNQSGRSYPSTGVKADLLREDVSQYDEEEAKIMIVTNATSGQVQELEAPLDMFPDKNLGKQAIVTDTLPAGHVRISAEQLQLGLELLMNHAALGLVESQQENFGFLCNSTPSDVRVYTDSQEMDDHSKAAALLSRAAGAGAGDLPVVEAVLERYPDVSSSHSLDYEDNEVIQEEPEPALSYEDLYGNYGCISQARFATQAIGENTKINERTADVKEKTSLPEYTALATPNVCVECHKNWASVPLRPCGHKVTCEAPPEILARGSLAVEAYNKALEEGRTRAKRVPVMLIGQDRSGKTSTKKSLMGKPFDPQEGSTVGIEVDPSYFEVSTEIWKTEQEGEEPNSDTAISYEHCAARLTFGYLKKEGTTLKDGSVALLTVPMDDPVSLLQGHKLDLGSSNESGVSEYHSKATEVARDLKGSDGNPNLPADVVPHPSTQGVLPGDVGSYQRTQNSELPEDVATLIAKFLRDGDSGEDEKDVHSVLWDFGGQSVYYATQPLFMTPQGIYLLIYDLSRSLHDLAKPVGKQGLYKKVDDVCCEKTNADYLDDRMSSVALLANRDKADPEEPRSDKLPKRLPPVFLVCTHADKPYGNTDSKTQAVEILGSLQTKPYSDHLFEDVFAVDNTKSGSGQNCPEVMRLRTELHAVATELLQMKEDIPLKWLKYEKHLRVLREKGHKWINLNEARQVALEVCNIVNDEEFFTLLNFLHDQRILLHFSDTPKLNKMVILDLQWLIDVFKKVITVKRFDPKEKEFKKQWSKLEKTGILERRLLEHVWGPLFDQHETAESLIAIMEKFSLLCPWPFSKGSQQYLVPSMLMSHPTDVVLELLASACASLFVKFDSGQVPQGLFPRLVLQFFQWCTEEWQSQLQPQLFHNFARFYTQPYEGRSVILLCHSSSIEITVHSESPVQHHGGDLVEQIQSKMTIQEFRHDPSDDKTCRGVRKKLGLVLHCMRKEFGWLKHMKWEICVCCTVCCRSGSAKYCRTHLEHNCKQEECLHLWSESELRKRQQPIFCNNYAFATENRVQVQQFAPWFPFLDEQQQEEGDERDGGHFLAAEHDEQFALALPSGVLETLQSEACDAKDVVVQLQESLQLDRASLEQPKPETKQLIRCLANKAKCVNRLDVVRYLRTITPAGTTGPLLLENHPVQDIPCRQRRDLTINLCGGDEWKEVAESLGLNPAEIRYLDNRTLNPCDAALAYIANQCYISVGNLYDVLVDCKLPQYADFL